MTGPNKTHSIARGDIAGVMKGFARTMAATKPQSLTPGERGRSVRHLPPQPVPVFAWVRYGPTAVRVAGYMPEWTDRASLITWTTPTGDEHQAWVWASAVDERHEDASFTWATAARARIALQRGRCPVALSTTKRPRTPDPCGEVGARGRRMVHDRRCGPPAIPD